jgi:predicted Rossmann fold nucleotide-binding protein DprA/Smf involved in DNA uptake
MEYLGNKELLKLKKTAFLASSTIPPDMVLRCYDWAAGEHEGGVVSGFSSKLEKDVLHFLLKTKCPIILVLARQMYKVVPDEMKDAITENRLLIISATTATRQSKATALARNRYICELADDILFVGVTEQSSLYRLKKEFIKKSTASSVRSTLPLSPSEATERTLRPGLR